MTKDEALKLALEAFDSMIGRKPERVEQAITAIKEALAQPEQKPLAWISTGPARMFHWTADKPAYGDDWVPLYTTPPQREFVGLTAKEKHEFRYSHMTTADFIECIKAKLKDKNTSEQE